ncbi:uncharacterized protein LOC116194823 [Punica granatum]|uniref:Uncharacterized protein LOC116194823 n=1 Tax=Punica granatum TaxID=22663 RepID=A0A6P8C9H9_PUNGR|nr:uncharacterized protein LOC116194823 [Punica granatum]
MEGKASSSSSPSAAFTRVLVLLLCFSHLLLSSLAVPATRSLNSVAPEEEASSKQDTAPAHQEEGMDTLEVWDGLIEGRMEMEESTDYPGAGANHRHDPKSPGTA